MISGGPSGRRPARARILSFFFLVVVIGFAACSNDSSNDGGTDATTEPLTDLCDLGSFSGNGNACPHASTRVCFPVCDAGGGCVCTGSPPIWQCTNPPECIPCNSSPVVDAECPDANEAGLKDVSTTDANDASD